MAIVLGGLGAALGLINLILIAALWRYVMATNPVAVQALADLADIETELSALKAQVAGAGSDTADLTEVAAKVSEVKAALAPPAQ